MGAWGVLGGLALDILIAILCLTLLLVLMTQTLDLWAYTAPVPLPFDWRSYRDTICGGDWRRGTMLWLMLVTTLAPTALHLAVGLGAVFSHSAQVDRQIAAILTPARDALKSTHARVKEKGDGARARLVLDPDAVHRLEDFLARKEVWARVTAITLFGLFMVALIYFVFELAQRFALPQLCPAP